MANHEFYKECNDINTLMSARTRVLKRLGV
jgi:hypothetical protein